MVIESPWRIVGRLCVDWVLLQLYRIHRGRKDRLIKSVSTSLIWPCQIWGSHFLHLHNVQVSFNWVYIFHFELSWMLKIHSNFVSVRWWLRQLPNDRSILLLRLIKIIIWSLTLLHRSVSFLWLWQLMFWSLRREVLSGWIGKTYWVLAQDFYHVVSVLHQRQSFLGLLHPRWFFWHFYDIRVSVLMILRKYFSVLRFLRDIAPFHHAQSIKIILGLLNWPFWRKYSVTHARYFSCIISSRYSFRNCWLLGTLTGLKTSRVARRFSGCVQYTVILIWVFGLKIW